MDQAFKIKTRNENFEVNFNKLDDSQRAAVEALGNNVVIRASAGSGKALKNGTSIYDIPLRVTYYARVSTDKDEQLNSLENQIIYYKFIVSEL